MNILGYRKLNVLVPAVCVLAAAVGAMLLVPGTKLLYGQAKEDSIPNLIGVWKGEVSGYVFANVADPGCRQPEAVSKPQCQPEYVREPESSLEITAQNERAFAALYVQGRNPRRVTGVVAPDGTVTMQHFSPTELRQFITGKVTFTDGIYEMNGHANVYDDFGLRSPENAMGAMATFTFRFTKVN